MRRVGVLLFCVVGLVAPVQAQSQSWGNLDAALIALSPTASMERSYFLPNTSDPATATRALGVVYAHIPGSAGSVTIHAGVLSRVGAGWQITRVVTGLYGFGPENPVFYGEVVEITMRTLTASDPRCCPSGLTRFHVDLITGQARPVN